MADRAQVTYPVVHDFWETGPFLDIRSQTEEYIARFPLEFLQQGQVLTWEYVRTVCLDILEAESGRISADFDGSGANLPTEPEEGTFYFVASGELLGAAVDDILMTWGRHRNATLESRTRV
jgi:hypothetical protein